MQVKPGMAGMAGASVIEVNLTVTLDSSRSQPSSRP
jgi:hypothetical protein